MSITLGIRCSLLSLLYGRRYWGAATTAVRPRSESRDPGFPGLDLERMRELDRLRRFRLRLRRLPAVALVDVGLDPHL